ncbi:MAG: amidohydrolase family protein, partial [Spirochaetaceae bacterium]
HGVYVEEKDIETFKRHGVKVSHCPVSNMILASGVAPVPRYLEEGIPVSLACDGAASNDTQNMLEVLKTTALLHKVSGGNAANVSAPQVLEMATLGGARSLGMGDAIGSLETGKKADFFIFDPIRSISVPIHDPVSALVYSASPSNIETTVVGGKVLLEKGELQGQDEEGILYKAQELARKLVARSGLGNVQWGQKVQLPPFTARQDTK